MISKEKLLNGYIENDQGELRKLWMSSATEFGFDSTWIDESFIFEGIEDALDCKYCFICDNAIDSGEHVNGKNKLTIEDFVNTDCKPETTKTLTPSDAEDSVKHKIPNETTKGVLMEVKNCTFTSSDIFQQMLTLVEQNNVFIQFDGFTQDKNDTIVVTKQGSDTEYVIETQEQFNQLVESFKLLEKFERS